MDIDHLNDAEVQTLIKRFKNPVNRITFDEAYTKISSLLIAIDLEEAIIDTEDIEYILSTYRGRIELDRFSIHIRFKGFNHTLVRINFNPSNHAHTNPDGEKIVGSHIHIYSDRFEKKDKYTIQIENSTFPNVSTLIDGYNSFLEYNNIK